MRLSSDGPRGRSVASPSLTLPLRGALLALVCLVLVVALCSLALAAPGGTSGKTTGTSGRPPRTAGPAPIEPVEKPVESDGPSINLAESSSLIRAGAARTAFGVNGAGLTVAVLDTGLRTTHTDFAGRVVAQANFTSDNGGDPNNATDGQGHGTNVAGIICAGAGHTGIAPGANVIPVKVLDNTGNGTYATVASGLQWVIDHRVQYNITVVNMSLGGGHYTSPPADSSGVRSRMATLRAAGVAVCCSAGNSFYTYSSTQGMGYPGICPESVSSGAVYDASMGGLSYTSGAIAYSTGADRITPFSERLHESYNSTNRTDIFAPGAALTSAGITSDTASSTMHGTSQASPVTAGACLLLQDYFLDATGSLPSVDTLEELMRDTAVTINDGDDEDDNVVNTGLNYLRVDVYAALGEVNPTPTLSSLSPASGTAGGASFTLTANGGGFVAESKVYWAGSPLTTTYVSGTQLTATVPAASIATPGTATVTVVTPTPGGGTSNGLPFVTTWPAPTVTGISPSSGHNTGPVAVTVTGTGFRAGSTVSLMSGATPAASGAATLVNSTQLTATLDLTGLALGAYDVKVTADDGQSGTLTGGFAVTSPHTTAPEIVSWTSLGTHGGGVGEIGLGLAEYGVEPRSSGLVKLELRFSEPLDPASVSPSVVTIVGKRSGNLSSRVLTASLNVAGDVLTLGLTRLNDTDTYTVTVSTAVRCLAGGIALAGDRDRVLVALKGDATRDRRVDTGDVLKVMANRGKPVTLSTAAYDLTQDGIISDADVALAKANMGHLAP